MIFVLEGFEFIHYLKYMEVFLENVAGYLIVLLLTGSILFYYLKEEKEKRFNNV